MSFSICVPLHFQEHKWKENIPEKTYNTISRGLTLSPLTEMLPPAMGLVLPLLTKTNQPCHVESLACGAPGLQQCPALPSLSPAHICLLGRCRTLPGVSWGVAKSLACSVLGLINGLLFSLGFLSSLVTSMQVTINHLLQNLGFCNTWSSAILPLLQITREAIFALLQTGLPVTGSGFTKN